MPVRHYDWIAHFGRRTPDKLAVVDLASGRKLSYAQFDARISRLASHLREFLASYDMDMIQKIIAQIAVAPNDAAPPSA